MNDKISTQTITVTKDNFDDVVLGSDVPVLVDFWAEWCGPCKAIGPTLEEIATELEGKAKIAKLNVDESPDLARIFAVRSIPTLILFADGEVQETAVGARPKSQLVALIEQHLASN